MYVHCKMENVIGRCTWQECLCVVPLVVGRRGGRFFVVKHRGTLTELRIDKDGLFNISPPTLRMRKWCTEDWLWVWSGGV